jgi:dihydrofolate reductase
MAALATGDGIDLKLIFARAANGVIGRDNALPWHLPEDLAHFKRTTLGCPVIMGRKTWDSLPARFRPLPGRRNIVVTRQTDWVAEGAVAVGSVEEAIGACHRSETTQDKMDDSGPVPAWVIGGAQLYAATLPWASTVVVTHINADFEGDAFAPVLDDVWRLDTRDPPSGWHLAVNGLSYAFATYRAASKVA